VLVFTGGDGKRKSARGMLPEQAGNRKITSLPFKDSEGIKVIAVHP
jgi:hypothetical protein